MSFKIPFAQTGHHDCKVWWEKITLFLFTNSDDSCTRGCTCVVDIHLIYWYTKEYRNGKKKKKLIYQQWYEDHRVWLQNIENYDFYLNNADM